MKKKIILLLFFWATSSGAWADRWTFLPAEPLFEPLIGDLREPQYGIIAQPDKNHYDGSIGQTIEILQWQPQDASQWGWGIEGDSYLQLDSLGNAIFPLRVSDWYLGTYFSYVAGTFSGRLEYEHVSSHLGDEFFYQFPHIIYSRESLRLTFSDHLFDNFRIYGGPCYWTHLSPDENDPRLFFHGGIEGYTDFSHFILGTQIRGYATYDIKILGEAGGVVDQTLQIGLQYKWHRDSHQSIQTALVFYTGNSPYGQFYQSPESYWGLGIFFEP